jgi:hypothetical protein
MSDGRLVADGRTLKPAHGAIMDDPVAGIRFLVHSHYSDGSDRRLHFGNVQTR